MHRTWTWTFELPPDQLWPLLADTNRFNEALGLPPYTLERDAAIGRHSLAPGSGQECGLRVGMGGKAVRVDLGPALPPVACVQQGTIPPFRSGSRSRVGRQRRITRHICARMGTADLGRPRIRCTTRRTGRRKRGEAHPGVVAFASKDQAPERLTPFILPEPKLPHGARERATAMAREIDRSAYGNGLGGRLVDLVLHGMAADLVRIRPKCLARELGVPPRAATEACSPGSRPGCSV